MTAGEEHTKGLSELLAKVQAASGADHELDGTIFDALIGVDAHDARRWYGGGIDGHISGSIDAALDFVDRVLPGWKWNVGMDALDEIHATIWQGVIEADQYAATAPLAILAATLQALIAGSKP